MLLWYLLRLEMYSTVLHGRFFVLAVHCSCLTMTVIKAYRLWMFHITVTNILNKWTDFHEQNITSAVHIRSHNTEQLLTAFTSNRQVFALQTATHNSVATTMLSVCLLQPALTTKRFLQHRPPLLWLLHWFGTRHKCSNSTSESSSFNLLVNSVSNDTQLKCSSKSTSTQQPAITQYVLHYHIRVIQWHHY